MAATRRWSNLSFEAPFQRESLLLNPGRALQLERRSYAMLSVDAWNSHDTNRAPFAPEWLMTDFIVVATTTETQEQAQQIARVLIESRLAACVQISGPITSCYRWEGAITTSQEWSCTAKTQRALFAQVEATIRREHPYELPEIVALPIVAGSVPYLDWLATETLQAPY